MRRHVLISALMPSMLAACVLAAAAGPAREWRGAPAPSAAGRQGRAAQTGGQRGAASLCQSDEQVIFSCQVRGSGKLLSLCGSRGLDDARGYLQYRFGRAGSVEMQFPETREGTQGKFRYTRYTRYLVTYLSVRFETNGYLYTIEQEDNSEEKPPVRSAGVTVTPLSELDKPSPKSTEFACRMPDKGSLMRLEGIVPRGEDEP